MVYVYDIEFKKDLKLWRVDATFPKHSLYVSSACVLNDID